MPSKLVPALCARLELPVPAPDETGGYALTLPDGFTVMIHGDRDAVRLSGRVQDLPASGDDADALCRELLTLSLGRTDKECRGGLPHLAVEGNRVVLRQRLPASPAAEIFETSVENFVNLLEKWRSLAGKEQGRRILRTGGGMQGIILP